MRSEQSKRMSARSRRIDLLGPATAVVAGVVYWLHGFDGYLSRDLALYAYANQQAADGVPPYLAVVNRSGPISHLFAVPGVWGARLVGGDELTGIRVWCLLLAAGCVWVAYLLCRDVFASRLAGLAGAAALLTVDGFTQYASDGPREKTAMVLFLLLGLWAVARRHPFLAGVCVSLATLTWQPAFFAGAVAAGVAALGPAYGGVRGRLRALAMVALGGALPLAFFLVWYAAIGHLRDFLDCFVLIHATYTEQPSLAQVDWFRILTEAYGFSLWVLFVGGAVVLLRALWVLVSGRAGDPDRWTEVAFGAALLAGILWSVRVFNGWPDIFFLLPMLVLGIAALARIVLDLAPRAVAGWVTAGWATLAVVLAVLFSVAPHDETLPEQRAAVRGVFSLLPDDATVVSIEAPQPLVLAGKTDPFRHQMFGLGLSYYVDDTWPGGRDGLREDIGRWNPTVITLGKYRRAWMAPLLERQYVLIGKAPGWTWYVNRSVGSDVLAELVSRSAP